MRLMLLLGLFDKPTGRQQTHFGKEEKKKNFSQNSRRIGSERTLKITQTNLNQSKNLYHHVFIEKMTYQHDVIPNTPSLKSHHIIREMHF